MLDGCLEWQQIGLAPPRIVTEATDAYFDDQDLIKQWLEECTEDGGPFAFTSSSQLFASWKAWCDARGLPPGNSQNLSDALYDRGFEKKRTKRGNGFKALTLKAHEEQESNP
jgi:phage/plasmid-associated DNA primase